MIKLKTLLKEQSQKILKKGSRGDQVKKLQTQLIQLGYLPKKQPSGKPSDDGIFGSATKAAIIKFQKNPDSKDKNRNKLKPDGIVGPATYYAISNKDLFNPTKSNTSSTTNIPDERTDDKFMSKIDTQGGFDTNQVNFKGNWHSLVDSTKKVNVCDAPDLIDKCASFVNVIDPTVASVGNAWDSWRRPMPGKKQTYNVMNHLKYDSIQRYKELAIRLTKNPEDTTNGGGSQNTNIKLLHKGIIIDAPKVSKSLLTPGSHVGIYWPKSSYHQEAFRDSSRRNPFKDPFNTHIGIVIAVKNGVPIILHEVGGKGYAEPYDNMADGAKIAWVKTNRDKTFFEKAEDAILPYVTDAAKKSREYIKANPKLNKYIGQIPGLGNYI